MQKIIPHLWYDTEAKEAVPENMDEFFANGSKEEIRRVTEAFLKMKKFDLAALEKARLGI